MQFDSTAFTIFGLRPYTVCVCIGLFLAISVYLLLLGRRGADASRQLPRLLLSLPAILIGAKLLGSLGNLLFLLNKGEKLSWDALLGGGIAFYGGLLSMLGVFQLLGRTERFRSKDASDALAVAIPLFHSIGRCGCYFAGCCYGISCSAPITVRYTNYIDGTAVTADRVPIQLFEATGCLLIFTVLLVQYLRNKQGLLCIYFLLYAILRFAAEFFRGDALRGMVGPFSISQIISILLLIYSVILIRQTTKKEERKL